MYNYELAFNDYSMQHCYSSHSATLLITATDCSLWHGVAYSRHIILIDKV